MPDSRDNDALTEVGHVNVYTGEFTLADLLKNYLNGFERDYDMGALTAAHQSKVEARMPDGVWLTGDTVYTSWGNLDSLDQDAVSEAFEVPEDEFADMVADHQVAYESATPEGYTRTVELADGRSVVYQRIDDPLTHTQRILDNGGGVVHEAEVRRDNDGSWIIRTRYLPQSDRWSIVYLETGEDEEFATAWATSDLPTATGFADHPGKFIGDTLRADH